jgi:hypothetical protein
MVRIRPRALPSAGNLCKMRGLSCVQIAPVTALSNCLSERTKRADLTRDDAFVCASNKPISHGVAIVLAVFKHDDFRRWSVKSQRRPRLRRDRPITKAPPPGLAASLCDRASRRDGASKLVELPGSRPPGPKSRTAAFSRLSFEFSLLARTSRNRNFVRSSCSCFRALLATASAS